MRITWKENCQKHIYRTIALALALISLQGLTAQKTDKVYLANGDILTGEIKNMKLAKLSFDLSGPGTISIKWEKVVGIRSNQIFEIMMNTGAILVGPLDSSFFAQNQISIYNIVELETIRDRFLRRLSGDVSLGFNYTKSSKILQFNFGGSITYRVPKLEIGIAVNSFLTDRAGDTALTKKQDVTISTVKYFGNQLFFGGNLGWQQNTELGLANRFLLSGAIGKSWISDNHNRLLTGGGASVNEEESIESKSYVSNLEAMLEITYKRFYYSTPKMNIEASFYLYPSLSDWGRVRMEFNVSNSFEIYKDFLIGLNFYDNFDNRPPQGATSINDYGINLTVSYEFGK
jgi:Protein of unknown function, DUF481